MAELGFFTVEPMQHPPKDNCKTLTEALTKPYEATLLGGSWVVINGGYK